MWVLSGSLSGRVVEFIFGVVLARLLLPSDFGLLVTVQIFTGVLGFVAGGGMGEALVQAKNIQHKDYAVVFTLQLAIGLLIYCFLFFLSPFIAEWFHEEIYVDLLRVTAITFILSPLARIPNAKLRREMRFKPVAIVQVCSILLSGVTSITLASFGMGPWSLILGGLAGTLSSIVLLLLITRWAPSIRFNRESARRLASFGFRFTANDLIAYARTRTANLLISHNLGSTQVGLFNKAESLAQIPLLLISGSAYQTVFRTLSSLQDNHDKSTYLFLRSITLVTFYTLPFLIGFLWLADPFITIVYGEKWSPAAPALQILSVAIALNIGANLSGAVIAAQNQLGREIRIQLESWAVLAAGIFIGLQGGITGVAAGMLPGYAYLSWRMLATSLDILSIQWKQLGSAVIPVLFRNAQLCFVLFAMDITLRVLPIPTHRILYFAIMAATGSLFYIMMFLYRPGKEMQSEADRWHAKLSKLMKLRFPVSSRSDSNQ